MELIEENPFRSYGCESAEDAKLKYIEEFERKLKNFINYSENEFRKKLSSGDIFNHPY